MSYFVLESKADMKSREYFTKTYVQTETDSRVVFENLRVLTRLRTSQNFPSGNNKPYTALKTKLLYWPHWGVHGLHAEIIVSILNMFKRQINSSD